MKGLRDIWFKGKCLYDGEWVYGYYRYFYDGQVAIIEDGLGGKFEVDFETISQYVGVNDKKGNKIFEGDIVKDRKGNIYTVECGAYYPSHYASFICQMYGDKIFGFYLKCNGEDYVIPEKPQVEVIGNIYDNPELLKQ